MFKQITTAIIVLGVFFTGSWYVLNKSEIKVARQGVTLGASIFQYIQGGTGTTTAPQGQLIYGGKTSYQSVATTSVTCSGSTSCTSFTAIGNSPITISSSGGAGGSGTVSTSTNEVAGRLAYWTSNSGTPALLGQIATSTPTVTAPITYSGTLGSFVGGVAGAFDCTSASAGVKGCITAADYSILKTATTTFTSPLVYTLGTNAVTCPTCNVTNASVSSITVGAGHQNQGTVITTTGTITGAIATSATPVISPAGLAYWTGVGDASNPAKLGTVATTTFTPNSDFSTTGTIGNFVGGANSTLALNMATAHNWTGLQSFLYSSSTLYSSFFNASSTFGYFGTLTISTTTAGCASITNVGKIFSTGVACGTGGSGTPAGSDTYVQYNNGGSFGAVESATMGARWIAGDNSFLLGTTSQSAANLEVNNQDTTDSDDMVRIISRSASGANADIHISSPDADIEFCNETMGAQPADCFEIDSPAGNNQLTLAPRNWNNTSYEFPVFILQRENTYGEGTIGIGTRYNSPDARLEVVATTSVVSNVFQATSLANINGTGGDLFQITNLGKTGISSTTPTAARLVVNSVATDLFSLWVGSTTAPWLRVSNSGFGTTTLSGLTIAGSATSTSNVGFNITTGCYAIGGNCLTGGGGGITDLGSGWATTTATKVTFSTTTLAFNGLTFGQTIVPTTPSTGLLMFTPTVTGTLTVAGGGTGATSFPANSILTSNSAGTGIIATSSASLYVGSIYATSTIQNNIFMGLSNLFGTTTGIAQAYTVEIASSTSPQLALSAGTGIAQWTFRNAGGNFYLSTSTVTGEATTTKSALSITNGGEISISTSTAGTLKVTSNGLIWSDTSSAGGGYATVQDEGSGLTARTILNFTGSGVSCADDAGNTRTNCTINAGAATAGGSDTQVQFNDSTALGGAVAWVWNKTKEIMGIGTTTPWTNHKVSIATSTGQNLVLLTGSNDPGVSFRNAGGTLFIGTTSPTTGATSTSPSAFTVDYSSAVGKVGIGSTTPFGLLGVQPATYDYSYPLLSIATSTGTFGSLMTVTATSSTLVSNTFNGKVSEVGVRVGIGLWDYKGYGGLLDSLTVNGTFNTAGFLQSWCDQSQFTALSADGIFTACPGWYFAEDNTGTTAIGVSNSYQYTRVSASTAAINNDGAGVFFSPNTTTGWFTLASSTPKMEVNYRIRNSTATTTNYIIGFSNANIGGTAYEAEPTVGCFFIASSTANWRAVAKTSNTAATYFETGIASTSSTVANGTGYQFRFMRVQGGNGKCEFFMQESGSTNMYSWTSTTNIPSDTLLNAGMNYGIISQNTSSGFDFFRNRIWWKDILPPL